jgi:hypothetical protein
MGKGEESEKLVSFSHLQILKNIKKWSKNGIFYDNTITR